MKKGRISFRCKDQSLNEGFLWARSQALSYSHEGDPVGDWYEAALPGRGAFCMRDVSHQCMGGQLLGLGSHNKNMLLRFAQSIAESRDFCSFWEIDCNYRPARVDYTSDNDFWYNLPANFDVMDACWRMHRYSADPDYVSSYDFTSFYSLTINQYVRRWDINGDGILERAAVGGRRGIPSYDEEDGMEKAAVMSDMLAIQIRGYLSAAKLFERGGDIQKQRQCVNSANKIREILENWWWDVTNKRFYTCKTLEGRMEHGYSQSLALSYYRAVQNEEKRLAHLVQLDTAARKKEIIVEQLSHQGEVFFFNGQPERGLYWLRRMIDPKLDRREYPELSYGVITCFICGLSGVDWNGVSRSLTVFPVLLEEVGPVEIQNLPVSDGELDISISEAGQVNVVNRSTAPITVNGVKLVPEKA